MFIASNSILIRYASVCTCSFIPETAQAESLAAVPERAEPVEGGGY